MFKQYGRKRRMKKVTLVVLVISILLYFSLVLINHKSGNDTTVAKIDSMRIYESDIKEKFLQLFNNSDEDSNFNIKKLPKEAVKSLSKEIYLERELLKTAKKEGIHKKSEIRERIIKSENAIIIESYLSHLIKKNTTQKAINNKYLQITTNLTGKKEYNISKIVLNDKELAQNIFNKLNKIGAKYLNYRFSVFYNKHSIKTPGESNKEQYILETLLPSDVVSKFDDGQKLVIKEFENGEIYIYKLNNSREVKIPELDDQFKEELKKMLTQEVMQKFIEKSLKDKEVIILDYK